MILKGNQRANGLELAAHLVKAENEHVEIHEIRGFASEDLKSVLRDMEREAEGTRCREPLYALSLNPPPGKRVEVEDLEQAAELVETRLGLDGQPRVFVLHEKQGRLHAHVVWSRIDRDSGKSVQLSHDRLKLQSVSKELYLQHGWDLPQGLTKEGSLSEGFSHVESMQFRRTQIRPERRNALIAEAWQSARPGEFQEALALRGFVLASGNRDYLAVCSTDGEAVNLTRALGLKVKELRAVLGDKSLYPDIGTVRDDLETKRNEEQEAAYSRMGRAHEREKQPLCEKREKMLVRQKEERKCLRGAQALCSEQAEKQRADRYRRGIMGLWDRVTGDHGETRRHNAIEREAERKAQQREMMDLRERHMAQSRELARQMRFVQSRQQEERISFYRATAGEKGASLDCSARIERRVETDARAHEQARPSRGMSL